MEINSTYELPNAALALGAIMIHSLIGRHFFNETQARLMASSGDPTSVEPACGAIIRAAKIHRESESLDHLVAGLSFRLSLACAFLRSLGWPENEQWEVALGFPDGLKEFDVPRGASVPHALADLSLVLATLIARDCSVIERDHRQLINASIGIVDAVCWENGEVTARGERIERDMKELGI